MRSLFSPEHLARVSARHPWRVVGAWVVVIVVAGALASGLSDRLATDWAFVNQPESVRGERLIEERLAGGPEPVTESVIVRSNMLTVDDPAFRQAVEATTAELAALEGVVASATNYYQASALGLPGAETLVSADRRTTIVPVTLAGDYEDAKDNAGAYRDAVERLDHAGFEIMTVGRVTIGREFTHQSEADLVRGELIAVPFAMLILLIVFRALVAASIPLGLAAVSIVVAMGLAALIVRGWELSIFVSNMITMIGLAVGIDYALFIIERYREERRRGVGQLDAITIAGGTASRAVVFSGLTVVLALVGLLVIPTTIFRSLGLGAILAVVAAVAAVLTLVPAILGLLGDRIEWPRWGRSQAPQPERAASGPGFWATVTGAVMARPILSTTLSAGVLLLLALPFLRLERTQTGVESYPESDIKTAYEILATDFAAGLISPLRVVVDAPRTPQTEAAIAELVASAEADGRFAPIQGVQWNAAGDLAVITAPLIFAPEQPAAYDVVRWLRADAIPAAFDDSGADVLVTGISARNTDFVEGTDAWTPLIFAFVLGLSFILLTLAFRSIVVPIKAIVMNLLSVGAAYGLLVLVFQEGYGAGLLGFQRMPAIESWIPIFLFCVLFGLSMDYHVFLLSRVREQYDRTRDNRESVAAGLQATARIITGAAMIMVVVFSGFAMGEMVMFQQMGFGLAVAIFLDATIVRSVLVPATMALLGELNWYLPRWLHWLPDLRVEGHATPPTIEPSLVPESADD
jgi:RND superfamily putative drug exporter